MILTACFFFSVELNVKGFGYWDKDFQRVKYVPNA